MPAPPELTAHKPHFHRWDAWKQPVRVVATSAGNISTAYQAGATVDGVTLAEDDRILLTAQTGGTANGIYVVAGTAVGTPTRAYDMDSPYECVGALVYVVTGSGYAGTIWRCTNTTIPNVGTDPLTFSQLVSSGSSVTPASTVTDETTWGISPSVGTGTAYARVDHTHGSPGSPTAGSGGALYPFDDRTLNSTYGDHFTAATLDAKWTLRSGTYVITKQGEDESWLYCDQRSATNLGLLQDWTSGSAIGTPTVTTSGDPYGSSYGGPKAVDADFSTSWATNNASSNGAWIKLTWGSGVTLRGCYIRSRDLDATAPSDNNPYGTLSLSDGSTFKFPRIARAESYYVDFGGFKTGITTLQLTFDEAAPGGGNPGWSEIVPQQSDGGVIECKLMDRRLAGEVGPCFVDSSGDGYQASLSTSPDNLANFVLSAYGYSGYQQIDQGYNSPTTAIAVSRPLWLRLHRAAAVGASSGWWYWGQASIDGVLWLPWVPKAYFSTKTINRIGVLGTSSTNQTCHYWLDWFDLT